MAITLNLTTNDLSSQGYETAGTQPFSVDTVAQRLIIGDASSTDFRAFFKDAPEIAAGEVSIDVIVRLDLSTVSTIGEDTGVHVALIEGSSLGREIRACCILRNGERRLALQISTGAFSTGIPLDWAGEQTFRLRRLANGDGVIEANGLSETVLHDRLAASSRSTPTFAIGCFVGQATALATFGPIGTAVQKLPIAILPTRCDLFPNAAEKVHIEGTFTLDAASDGIDPVAETVALRLFNASGARVYPVGTTDTMPVAFEVTTAGWQITAAEKTRTGLQTFEITKTTDAKVFGVKLVDTQTSLPQADYTDVKIALGIGNDDGSLAMKLAQQSNGVWKLA